MSADRTSAPGRLVGAARVVAANVALLLFLLALPEVLAALFLKFPGLLGAGSTRDLFRRYYADYDRNIIQFLPECAEYDPELTYRLRPGGCTVANREHTVDYEINRLGSRDDEASLEAPEWIVLGDSHAMGWGVDRDETFAELLEASTGRKVLNLGISSYGTARELRLLARADTSRLSTLVLQYCDNDRRENATYLEEGDRLPISDRAAFEETIETHRRSTRYTPMKHTRRLLQIWSQRAHLEPSEGPKNPEAAHRRAASDFLQVLATSEVALDEVEIVVIEINGHRKNDGLFIEALEAELAADPNRTWPWRRLLPLDLSPQIGPEVRFQLDAHMRPEGHRRVADAIAEALVSR